MSPSKRIQAKTFTVIYVEKEDRLLLSINYQDISNRIDFWITRAFLVKLLPYFFEYNTLESDVTSPDAQEREKETKKSTTDSATFSLMQPKPFLLESIDFQVKKNGLKLLLKNLEFKIFCQCNFSKSEFSTFVSLVTSAAPTYQWGIYTS